MSNNLSAQEWDIEIKPQAGLFDLKLKDLWTYRDLLMLFVKRDIVTVYKQTLLGPLWFFIQPILTTITFIVIFGNIAKIGTDGLPQALFYMGGITTWNYFSEAFTSTSKTFTENANIFGKVYFPRLILPLSKVISGLVKFFIQFSLFIGFFFYYYFTGSDIHPNFTILLVPFYIILMAILGLGFGLIFSSLTTKYRDLSFLITFGVQLLMYGTTVLYPLSEVKIEILRNVIKANPMTPIIEGFRYAFTGSGSFDWNTLLFSTLFSFLTLFIGIVIFNRVEKSFMDTV